MSELFLSEIEEDYILYNFNLFLHINEGTYYYALITEIFLTLKGIDLDCFKT